MKNMEIDICMGASFLSSQKCVASFKVIEFHLLPQPAIHAHMHMYFKISLIILMRCTNTVVIYRSNILRSAHPDVPTVTHVNRGMSVCTGICN